MDGRQERGLQIATNAKIVKNQLGWKVPSQSGNGSYIVNLDHDSSFCTCPDFETHQQKCKHIYAVEFTLKTETNTDGLITETRTVKVTYGQDWTAYNTAQTEEKTKFVSLLSDLCKGVAQPEQGMGRRRLPLSEMVFASAFKVYSGFSGRRFTSDVNEIHDKCIMANTPHFNSVSNYMVNPEITPILKSLITISSLPLKTVETDFSVDSSGFSTSRFVKWFNKKYGYERGNQEWVKVHLMCGTNTHVVTSAEISGWMAHDTNYFKPLVEATANNFQIAEISADKGYLSHDNVNLVQQIGATPFIPFKSNTIASSGNSAWAKMYNLYMFNNKTFMEHYHKRSNVESVFSMIKAKFGDSIRSKSDNGQVNEVLCKVLNHNICVLIQSIHELGIEPSFN